MNIKSTSKRWKGGDTKDKIRYKSSELVNAKRSEPSKAINTTTVKGNEREDSKGDGQM